MSLLHVFAFQLRPGDQISGFKGLPAWPKPHTVGHVTVTQTRVYVYGPARVMALSLSPNDLLTINRPEQETSVSQKNSLIARLREEVKPAEQPWPELEDGQVVTFKLVYRAHGARQYSYAAIFINGSWYLTGEAGPQRVRRVPHKRLLEIYRESGVPGSFKLASKFEDVD